MLTIKAKSVGSKWSPEWMCVVDRSMATSRTSMPQLPGSGRVFPRWGSEGWHRLPLDRVQMWRACAEMSTVVFLPEDVYGLKTTDHTEVSQTCLLPRIQLCAVNPSSLFNGYMINMTSFWGAVASSAENPDNPISAFLCMSVYVSVISSFLCRLTSGFWKPFLRLLLLHCMVLWQALCMIGIFN